LKADCGEIVPQLVPPVRELQALVVPPVKDGYGSCVLELNSTMLLLSFSRTFQLT
jgi:hypothetical protein